MIKYLLNFISVVFLCGCFDINSARNNSASVVGLWKESSPTVSAITCRKANGIYLRKEIQIYDYSKQPHMYESSGYWSIDGNKYKETLENVNSSVWKNYVGKQWTMIILSLTETDFRYLSTDGAVVEEKRIEDSSEANFKMISLKTPVQKMKSIN